MTKKDANRKKRGRKGGKNDRKPESAMGLNDSEPKKRGTPKDYATSSTQHTKKEKRFL